MRPYCNSCVNLENKREVTCYAQAMLRARAIELGKCYNCDVHSHVDEDGYTYWSVE